MTESKPIKLKDEILETKRSTPLQDAFRQFRANRAAVVGVLVILTFAALAISASYLTELGVLDYPKGYRATHDINPTGYTSSEVVDSFPDPGHCARDNLDKGKPWCELIPEEQRAKYSDECFVNQQIPESQWCYVLGGGPSGKDWMTQTVYGAQVSLAVAVLGSSVSLAIGIIYGVIAGFYGGRVDNLMMRFVDFMYGMPGLVIIILMQVFFREISREYQDAGGLLGVLIDLDNSMGGLFFLFIAIGLFSWIGMARLARGQVLAYREQEFVQAARAVGASNRRIIFIHLLPNIIGPLLVAETLAIPGYIFTEAGLSFIGLGVQPGTPSWGDMISRIRQDGGLRSNQHLVLVPSVALVLLTLAFNFFGDGLRDAFDPRLRGSK